VLEYEALIGESRMGVTAKSLGIDKLDVENKLALIGELWDSVSSETEALPLPSEFKAELDRRIEAADSDPDSAVDWDQVKQQTLSRLRK